MIKAKLTLFSVLFLAVICRLIQINQSLWWDEAINVVAARENGFWDFVTRYPIGDFHPPGYFGVLWLWGHLFGFSEVSVRLPSVIFGVLSVWVIYLLSKQIFNKQVAWWSALLLAVSPLHVYYSQEARMYSLAFLAVLLSNYYLVLMLKAKKGLQIGFVLATVLLLYSDYVAYLIIPVQLIYVAICERKYLRKYIACLAFSGVALLPWLPIFFDQLMTGRNASDVSAGWRAVVGSASLKELGLVISKSLVGKISFENKWLYGGIVGVLGGLYFFVIGSGLKHKQRLNLLLLGWLIGPVLLAFVISLWLPILSYFRVAFVISAGYILVACGLEKVNSKFRNLIFGVLVSSSLIFLSVYYLNPKFQREDWRGLVINLGLNLNSQTRVIFEDNIVPSAYRYYSRDLNFLLPGLVKTPAVNVRDLNKLDAELSGVTKVLLVDYLVEINDPNRLVEQQLRQLKFGQTNIQNYNGVGFVREFRR